MAVERKMDYLTNEKIAPIKASLGWDGETYIQLNPDLSRVSGLEREPYRLAHFLNHGVNERRLFSKNVDYAQKYFFDSASYCDEFVIIEGWSEIPLSHPCAVVKASDKLFCAVSVSHISYWRDDVAIHLDVPVKETLHGFVLLFRLADAEFGGQIQIMLRDGERLLVGSLVPKKLPLEAFIQSTFNLLQARLTYDELVYIFSKHYDFLSSLRSPMRLLGSDEPMHFGYGGACDSDIDLSVCAVLLGGAELLKPFLVSLMAATSEKVTSEILLLVNGGFDIDDIRSAAEWCRAAYGTAVSVFSSKHNIGFGGGMNFLTTKAKGRLVMLSNTDLRFENLDFSEIERETNAGQAILAAYQLNPWGSIQHAGLVHDRVESCVNGQQLEILQTRLLGRNTLQPVIVRKEVDYFGAACLVAEANTLRSLGPFSLDYFYAYHEDCDLARRARARGIKCVLSPALQVTHFESSGAKAVNLPLRAINAANLVTFMMGERGMIGCVP